MSALLWEKVQDRMFPSVECCHHLASTIHLACRTTPSSPRGEMLRCVGPACGGHSPSFGVPTSISMIQVLRHSDDHEPSGRVK
jgi:hypothetical protein